MDRMKELEDIIRNDVLLKERKVKDVSVDVHVIGKRDHDDLIAEIVSSQHKYAKYPQLKQPTYLLHQCVRGGPPSKKNNKHIGCKAYMSFKKMSHPMGGNVLVVTEKDLHSGHDPESIEDSLYHTPQKKRKKIQGCASVDDLIEMGWTDKVINKGSGVFKVPMEVNEGKGYTVYLPELSCSCRAGKKQLICKHIELLIKMQEEARVENLNELMLEEARNMLLEEVPRYSILSREAGELKVYISAHKISAQCSLSSKECACPAFAHSGICAHLHLASLLMPEFSMESNVVEEITYGNAVTEEVILNTSSSSHSYISKLNDVIHYLEASNPSGEMAFLIDELHSKVKDNFVYVVSYEGAEES